MEWVNYNIWIGFDHIVIFNNDDDPAPLSKILARYVEKDYVTIIHWKSVGDQRNAYKHGLRRFGKYAASVTFLDGDEFIVLCEHHTVYDAYRYLGLYESPNACLDFMWLPFSASGHDTEPPENVSVTEYLTRRSSIPFTDFPGKVALKGLRNFHRTKIIGKPLKEPLWHSCGNRRDFVSKLVDVNVVRINHYQFRYGRKSLERRVQRGYAKDFKDQRLYADMNINELPSIRNETEDFTMAKIRSEFPQLLENISSSKRKEVPSECMKVFGTVTWTPLVTATMKATSKP